LIITTQSPAIIRHSRVNSPAIYTGIIQADHHQFRGKIFIGSASRGGRYHQNNDPNGIIWLVSDFQRSN
jgi:hypothetical protein